MESGKYVLMAQRYEMYARKVPTVDLLNEKLTESILTLPINIRK